MYVTCVFVCVLLILGLDSLLVSGPCWSTHKCCNGFRSAYLRRIYYSPFSLRSFLCIVYPSQPLFYLLLIYNISYLSFSLSEGELPVTVELIESANGSYLPGESSGHSRRANSEINLPSDLLMGLRHTLSC